MSLTKLMCLLPMALAPALSACATEAESDENLDEDLLIDDELENAELATAQSALCIIPPTPPAYDVHWDFTGSIATRVAYVNEPGSGECEAYVINARNVETFQVTINEPADTPDKCVGTSLFVREYEKNSNGSWSFVEQETATGVWTHTGCRLPKVSWAAHTQSDARIHITSKRTYTSGQFSVTQRGLSFVASGNKFETSVPH